MLFIVTPVQAGNKVLGLKIDELFNEIEVLYNKKTPNMDELRKLKAFYTSPDFKFKQESISNLGKKTIFTELNREEYLVSIKEPSGKLSNSSISYTITDIRYLGDGISADVDYTSLFKGDITKEQDYLGLVLIKFQSLTICTERFRLEGDNIKSYNADCKAEMLYKQPVPINK